MPPSPWATLTRTPFFFSSRRRHTRWTGDWSSDVCSSDLLGLFGVVATAPGIVALPAGVWLANHLGMAAVAGLTAASALVPLAAFPLMSGGADRQHAATRRQTPATRPGAERPDGLLSGLRRPGQLRPFLIFAASTVAGGVVVSFLPL